jgi:hypothetical protein
MRLHTPAQRTARFILLLAALSLPTLSLIPLGGLYLWEKGYLLIWAAAALVVIGSVSAWNYWLMRPRIQSPDSADAPTVAKGEPAEPDPRWSSRERQAWSDVLAMAAKVDVNLLQSVDAFVDLGTKTIEIVAHRLHPDKHDPVWQFTAPEAMTIAEQVSRRLGVFVHTHVPFGDRLTLAQIRSAYRWRGAVDVAEKAYDVWRMVRMVNPATAMTHEARERLSRALLTWGKEHVTRRIAETYVEEVGRAAIDLYGGRLRNVAHIAADPALDSGAAGEPPMSPKRSLTQSRIASGRQAIGAAVRGTRSLFRSRKR